MNTNEILNKLNMYSEIQEHVKMEYAHKFGIQAWYELLDGTQHLDGITTLKLAISYLATCNKA